MVALVPQLSLSSRVPLQIWVDDPTQNSFIALPDASGVFVVQALAPLFINNTGTVTLDQSQIVQVSQLTAGSIGRTFGKTFCLYHLLLQEANTSCPAPTPPLPLPDPRMLIVCQ